MVFPIAGGNQSTAYEISNSLRFADGYLNRTTGTATSDKKLTLSFWLKNSVLGTDRKIIAKYADSNNRFYVDVSSAGNLRTNAIIGGTNSFTMITDRVLLDPSAWMHIVLAFDTTQGTAANRIKIYVNGVQETSFSTETYPNQNLDLYWNSAENAGYIGYYRSGDTALGIGYLADLNFIDGAQKEASDFGRTDGNGVWVPKKYLGTYGDEGFFLEFQQTGTSANASGKGADTSGNTNHFDDNSMATTDVTTDTPTNNYCTLNPLTKRPAANGTITESNMEYEASTNDSSIYGTMGIPPGMKVYFEVKLVSNTAQNGIGIHNLYDGGDGDFVKGGSEAGTFSFKPRGAANVTQYFNNGNTNNTSVNNYANDTIIGVAVDNANGQIHYHVDGTYLNNSDPTDNDPVALVTGHDETKEQYLHFSLDTTTTQPKNQFNFGNPVHSISSANADANGHGSFEFAVPSGYFALNSKNLAEHG